MIQFTPEQVADAAHILLLRCMQLGQDYAVKLQIMRDDRGWDSWQIIGACVAYVIEHDLHTEIPQHRDFEPGGERPPESTICSKCHQPFEPHFRYQQWHTDPACPTSVD
jgi:hypothetical protein